MDIKFVKAEKLREKPNYNALGFGKYYADYMFEMDWITGKGFCNPTIHPYGPIVFDPASLVLHYAQETFEGLKAYKDKKTGNIRLFRPEMNAKRFQTSNARLCMPEVPVDDFVQAVKEVVLANEDWIPTDEGTSLYIRPYMFAYEPKLGVHSANHYKFIVICSPVAAYYKDGLKPVKIYVEDELVRAVKGGTGFIKCGGNYAASILAQDKAEKLGYTQVLWLDGCEHKYVEEVGTMNVMFLIDGKVVTGALEGSLLPGVTRNSIINVLKSWNIPVEERELSIDELMEAGKNGKLQEAFGTGTAAVISPIGELNYKGEIVKVNNEEIGNLTQKLYDYLTGIQTGKVEDPFNWVHIIK